MLLKLVVCFFPGQGCQLPRCRQAESGVPGKLGRQQTPMLVYLSFDDGVTGPYFQQYKHLFLNPLHKRRNPNGCTFRATFFVSDAYTNYTSVQALYSAGHEIASHSINHISLKKVSKDVQRREIAGQRQIISSKTGIPTSDIRGARMPFLYTGGDRLYDMMEEEAFLYDSSIPYTFEPPLWPHTMHTSPEYCDKASQDCPSLGHGVWQVPINGYLSTIGDPLCTFLDGCRPSSAGEAFDLIWNNFQRHYNAPDKPPFGINMHAAWFIGWPHTRIAMDRFLDKLQTMKDVYVVSIKDVIQWIKTPVELSNLKNFTPFQC